jgi:hypothetical protein
MGSFRGCSLRLLAVMAVDDGMRSHVDLEIALVNSNVLGVAKNCSDFLERTSLSPISIPVANQGSRILTLVSGKNIHIMIPPRVPGMMKAR